MASSTADIASPGLQEATKKSTTVWREHLEQLFHHAKDRFPDVVWEVTDDEDDASDAVVEEVWGHKAIVYARAPPSFQSRYFSLRQQPYSSSPTGTLPTTSALSLDIVAPTASRTPSPFRPATSPTPSATLVGTPSLLRLTTNNTPALFSKELEYLYTGQGFGEAFEFLFDTSQPEADAEEMRIDKLRKDLVFMWRSRLYSDVRIALTGAFSTSHENTTAIFSSHRFILVSRSPYFYNALLYWPVQSSSEPGEPPALTLPSPPFTPASLHFTLGFIYTGTLVFSHRSYDLTTAFQILRSALYLSIPTLHDEVQARVVQEMLHGLFHAFLPFPEYERLTAGAWGTGGCRCRQCARRIPRVLEFSLADDVKNPILERGARRALVGLFGEGWCTPEFAALHVRLRDGIVRGLAKRTTPPNAFPLLFAAEHALGRLGAVIDAWAAEVKEMVFTARKAVDDLISSQSEACFCSREWNEIMERDGVAFEDAERVQWIIASIFRGVNERSAPQLYQTLVSSILLRPHPTEMNAPMLPPTSHIRVQVEQGRLDLLKWIAKRWLNIRQESGFDELEGWALKEISDHIEVPLEDLIRPSASSGGNHYLKPPRPSTLHRAKESESTNDTISMHSSMRVSVLNRNLTSPITSLTHRATSGARGASPSSTVPSSSASSYKSLPRTSTVSLSRKSLSKSHKDVSSHDEDPEELSPDRDDASTYNYSFHKDNSRPDSKLTPALSSIGLPPYVSSPRSVSPISQLQGNHHPGFDGDASREDPRILPIEDALICYDDTDDYSLHSTGTDTPPSPNPSGGSTPPSATSSSGLPQKITIRKVPPTTNALRRTTASSKSSVNAPSLRPSSSNTSMRSSASASTARTHATVSTIRKGVAGSSSNRGVGVSARTNAGSSSARGTSTLSILSTTTTATTSDDGTGTFHSASSSVAGGTRTRHPSTASTVSLRSTSGTVNLNVGVPRARRSSTASVRSNVSINTSASSTSTKKRPAVPPLDTGKASSVKPRLSVASVRSTLAASGKIVAGTSDAKRASSRPVARSKRERDEMQKEEKVTVENARPQPEDLREEGDEESAPEADISATFDDTTEMKLKLATSVTPVGEHKKSESTASNATLKCRASTDTITTTATSITEVSKDTAPTRRESHLTNITNTSKNLPELPPSPLINVALPRGATLEIGIPCIISSKRKRFKAYARYIGEVEGEDGPWVGVEVPMNDTWSSSANPMDGDDSERPWHDGSWGGIRYFEIRGEGNESEWEYGDDARVTRRQRLDWFGGLSVSSVGLGTVGRGKGFLKREGEQLGREHASKRIRSVSPSASETSGIESRGLFVRPQQVLYVVDAVGSDL